MVNATLTIANSTWLVPTNASAVGTTARLLGTGVDGVPPVFVWNASWVNKSAQLTFSVVPLVGTAGLCDSEILGLLLTEGGDWAQQPTVSRTPGKWDHCAPVPVHALNHSFRTQC